MKYCTNCGSQISETPNFCPSCGNKIIYSESTHTPEPAIFDSLDTNVSDVIKTESKQEKQPNDKSVELKPNINYSNKKTIIIVGFTALIIVLVFTVILFSQGSKSAETQPSDSSASLNGVIENNTSSLQIPDAQDSSIDPNNTQSYETTDAVTERNILLRNNWTSYISASRSTFNYSEMGGISDLSIILTNNTEYIVDNVTVKVTIKTVNNYVYKTEYLYFENIKPNSRVEQFVMPTERGRYVEYEIINVYSDRLNFKWDEGDNTGNGSLEDPWKYNN